MRHRSNPKMLAQLKIQRIMHDLNKLQENADGNPASKQEEILDKMAAMDAVERKDPLQLSNDKNQDAWRVDTPPPKKQKKVLTLKPIDIKTTLVKSRNSQSVLKARTQNDSI